MRRHGRGSRPRTRRLRLRPARRRRPHASRAFTQRSRIAAARQAAEWVLTSSTETSTPRHYRTTSGVGSLRSRWGVLPRSRASWCRSRDRVSLTLSDGCPASCYPWHSLLLPPILTPARIPIDSPSSRRLLTTPRRLAAPFVKRSGALSRRSADLGWHPRRAVLHERPQQRGADRVPAPEVAPVLLDPERSRPRAPPEGREPGI